MQKYFTEARSVGTWYSYRFSSIFTKLQWGLWIRLWLEVLVKLRMSAVAVGFSIWLPAILLAKEFLMALTPIVAQMNGSGRRNLIGDQIQQDYG